MAKKVFQSMDGNQAAAWGAYAFTEVAGIYPITPSSPMAEYVDEWAAKGQKNLFGAPVKVVEMQSEAGAVGTVHGSLQAGALTTTFTASQGLLLKIPNMYKIAGELLPGVIHVAARSLAVQALSIFGDHQDVMACRQTGFAMLASSSVQEVMDLAGVAHLSAIKSSVPFMHFFDGFRTSHEIQKVEVMPYEVFDKLLDKEAVEKFRKRALSPNHPVTRGSAQNDDVYFQAREAQNEYYNAVPDIVAKYMKAISKETGRDYAPFVYYGAKDATDVIIAMGSVCDTATEVVDYLTAKGRKVGLVKVHLYRPFAPKYLVKVLPRSVKRIAVLDRTKENGALGEPLYLDIVSALYTEGRRAKVIGGRYGLSSKDTTPGQILAVYDNLAGEMKDHFTIGINDDVTHLSLPVTEEINTSAPGTSQLIFFGLGSDGTVGANKSTIKLIGDNTDYYAQAYFAYDSKKSGGVTRSHLRFGKSPIKSPYLVTTADFVSCSLDTYVEKFDLLGSLKDGGTFLLNTVKSEKELVEFMPNSFKAALAKKHVKFFYIDAISLAREIGLKNRTNTILQSAFFKLNEQIMPYDHAQELMKKYAYKSYAKKGDAVVEMNYKAIDRGAEGLKELKVDPAWAKLAPEKPVVNEAAPEFVKRIATPINAIKGYDLPVSTFLGGFEDGTMTNGSAAFEKRYVASFVPVWNPENCIQCNQCSFACPHAVIRPFLVTPEEEAKAPKDAKYLAPVGKGLEGLKYTMQISVPDCTGCEVCVNTCPGKKDKDTGEVKKALKMVSIDDVIHAKEDKTATYFFENVSYKTDLMDITANAKNSQFAQPLFEFSGACGGCGETPYIKLITQLFGDRMLVANATGCSSIYGGSYPATPYTTNKEGHGPAWANSLFEDNAEFGYGMRVATNAKLKAIIEILTAAKERGVEADLAAKIDEYFAKIKDRKAMRTIVPELIALIKASKDEGIKDALAYERDFADKSVWIVGGDGWGYDIGYGGLDHVIANEEDVNILLLDTEVYSNTGGQSSKSSQTGSIAKFTASGKTTAKKNLALIAMSYGNVYVAQISLGANPIAAIKALKEAESYDGPSLVICYAPCANHGIKGGLANSMRQERLAVECGYFPIFRYDPRNVEAGKPALTLDMKDPDYTKFRDFVMTETRFSQLPRVNPNNAEALLTKSEKCAKDRLDRIKKFGL